jgi:hypothetical protein
VVENAISVARAILAQVIVLRQFSDGTLKRPGSRFARPLHDVPSRSLVSVPLCYALLCYALLRGEEGASRPVEPAWCSPVGSPADGGLSAAGRIGESPADRGRQKAGRVLLSPADSRRRAGRQVGSGLAMQHRPKSSFLFLALILFSQAVSAATLFPSRSRGWNKIPTIVVLGREGGSRNQLVNDAVDFWNKQLTEIGSGFRLGPVTFISEIIPPGELAALSRDVLDQQGLQEPPSGLMQIDGDLIIALIRRGFCVFHRQTSHRHPQLSGAPVTVHQRRSQRHSS